MRFMPAARTCCSMAASAPAPSAIIVSTAATPIVIPSIVSAVWSLWRRSALTAMAKLERKDIFTFTPTHNGRNVRLQVDRHVPYVVSAFRPTVTYRRSVRLQADRHSPVDTGHYDSSALTGP